MRWILWGVLGVVVAAAIGLTVMVTMLNKQNFVADKSAPDYQDRIVTLWPDDAVPDYKAPEYALDDWPWYIRYLQKDDFEHKPYMLKYLVDGDTPRPAVLIFPGGGYMIRSERHEGVKMARWLNSIGINAFVVNYRLIPYLHPVPLNDAKKAMALVRENADAWGIDTDRVGVMGFSAGGHLAGLASNMMPDELRPDFAIIGYGVLAPATIETSELLSKQFELAPSQLVTEKTPPTFVWLTKEDPVVPIENATVYHEALQKAGVPVEMHLFETGTHGLGLAEDHDEVKVWPALAEAWMRRIGVLL